MSDMPRTRSELLSVIQSALDRHRLAAETVNEEHLALLATGQLHLLSVGNREMILRQVAADPVLAQAVADVAALGLVSPARPSPGRTVLRIAWVLAACLAMAVAIWRLVEPPKVIQTPQGTFQLMAGSQRPSYWEQLDQQRLSQMAQREQLRDWALYFATGTALILAIPVAWMAFRVGLAHDRPPREEFI